MQTNITTICPIPVCELIREVWWIWGGNEHVVSLRFVSQMTISTYRCKVKTLFPFLLLGTDVNERCQISIKSRVVNLFATDIRSRNLLWCDDVLHKPVSQLPYVNIFSLTHRKATSTSILLHSLSALMSALKPILKW